MRKMFKCQGKISQLNNSRKLREGNQTPFLFHAFPSLFLLIIFLFLMNFNRYQKAQKFMEKTGMSLDDALAYFEKLEEKKD